MTNIRTGSTAAAIAIVLALGPAACATSDSAVSPAAVSAPSDAAGIRVSESALPVQHVTMSTPKRFADVKRDMETRLGRLTDDIRVLSQQGRTEELRAALTRIAGRDGLALHYTAAHGDLLQLKGERRPTVVYYIGNVLSAVEMTDVDYGAGLYAPLRVVLYANERGGTTFEYDKPSTLFGQFGEPHIDEVAASLDARLDALLRAVSV